MMRFLADAGAAVFSMTAESVRKACEDAAHEPADPDDDEERDDDECEEDREDDDRRDKVKSHPRQ